MQKILLLCILILTLFGDNPKVYPQLGDSIYNNVGKIDGLKNLDAYKHFESKIDEYSKKVKDAKILGNSVQNGSRSNLKLDYLEDIRSLSKVNDYFLRTVKSSYESAIKTKNNDLFISMVNSKLLDTDKYKKSIMTYYNAHKDSINPKGVIQGFIDEAQALKKKVKKRWKPKTKKQLHEEKVKRLRANDKLKQEAVEEKLATELKAKKQKIRNDQERELFH